MEHKYEICYGNVKLRPLKEQDIECLRNWRNNAEISRFLTPIGYISRDAQKRWYVDYVKNEDEITFAIIDLQNEEKVVGSVSIYNIQKSTAEIGKIVVGDKDAQGKKIGTKAFAMGTHFAFEMLKVERMRCFVNVENRIARHIYSKIGFDIVGKRVMDGVGEEEEREVLSQDFYEKNPDYQTVKVLKEI